MNKLNETLTQRRKDLMANPNPVRDAHVERYKALTGKISASTRKEQQEEAAARTNQDPLGGFVAAASATPTGATNTATKTPARRPVVMRSPVTVETLPSGEKVKIKDISGAKSPVVRCEDALYVRYNEDLVRRTSQWTNEGFLRWFTRETIDGCHPNSVKTCLGIAWERGILSRIDPEVLKYANETAWNGKKSWINLSPLKKQIKSRLTKEYKQHKK